MESLGKHFDFDVGVKNGYSIIFWIKPGKYEEFHTPQQFAIGLYMWYLLAGHPLAYPTMIILTLFSSVCRCTLSADCNHANLSKFLEVW